MHCCYRRAWKNLFVSEWTSVEEKWTTASVKLDKLGQQAARKILR